MIFFLQLIENFNLVKMNLFITRKFQITLWLQDPKLKKSWNKKEKKYSKFFVVKKGWKC
jgi:hypothetical protein